MSLSPGNRGWPVLSSAMMHLQDSTVQPHSQFVNSAQSAQCLQDKQSMKATFFEHCHALLPAHAVPDGENVSMG